MLPDLIELVPPRPWPQAVVTVPGSKSITNRALILAALASGETTLQGALWSEDTQVMVECLQELGFMINVAPDATEIANRTITVYGKAGTVPSGGTLEQPLDLFVGNAGTAARFLTAFVCLGKGVYRLHGVPRMHERPQAALFEALRALGYRLVSANNKLPVTIYAEGPKPGKCQISIEESSQFASALLLSAAVGGWEVAVSGRDSEEASYVALTSKMVESFPRTGGIFQVEPDASSGSYFWAAGLLGLLGAPRVEQKQPPVSVGKWPNSGWQIDERFPKILGLSPQKPNAIPGTERSAGSASFMSGKAISRATDLGDSIMTAITIAPLLAQQEGRSFRFTDLGRLRVQECERVLALRTELTKCGAKVQETGDTLEIFPSDLRPAEIETYNDHRMAMCFAILGLKIPGIKINNPGCVKKTFPNFFQKLAQKPPLGLGLTILEARSRRPLEVQDLFAD